MNFVRFGRLPETLQAFARIILAGKSLEAGKEERKALALAALKNLLGGEKAVIAVSGSHFIQFDVNPQQHVEFDPLDPSPEISAVLDAQARVKEASSLLAAAVKAALAAGRATTCKEDSIRVEVLSRAKLVPIKRKYAPAIRQLRQPLPLTAPAN